MEKKSIKVNENLVISKIYLVRGLKVMLDEDLAEMYCVLTKRLNEQVKRNIDRFPEDFMFQLTEIEYDNLRSQFATASYGGRRNLPYAFTEYGVLMLSSVLNSSVSIQVNIQIMRVYAKLREMLLTHKDILLKLESLEKQVVQNNDDIQMIFGALKQLLNPSYPPIKPIGFKQNIKKKVIKREP